VIVIELALPLYDEAEKGARVPQRGNVIVVVGDRQQIVVLKPIGAMKGTDKDASTVNSGNFVVFLTLLGFFSLQNILVW
jgi:hypothetical protein